MALQEEVLRAVVEKKMSLADLKEAAGRHRAEQVVCRAFCRCTNTTWEEACERFPNHTTKEQLSQFLRLSFLKSIPAAFHSYCQAALQSEHHQSHPVDSFVHNGATVFTVNHSSLTVSHTHIKENGLPFHGCHLFIAAIPEVRYMCVIRGSWRHS